ncbi:PhzF family phenazine biosynthesis protein [Patescibacteria group bacterium]
MKTKVHTLNVFGINKDGGNPAGVVLDSEKLSDSKMKKISKKVGYSETAFISKSKKADYKIRFFTPKKEIDICGHATIASAFLLKKLEKIEESEFTQESNLGVLRLKSKKDEIFMELQKPEFNGYLDRNTISTFLNIKVEDIANDLHPEIVSTGLRDVIVPLKKLKTLENLQPNFERMSKFNNDTSTIGLHIFTLETKDKESTAHTRNFAPLYDINEESATGSSNGSLACYLHKHKRIKKTKNLSFEQGYSMQMPSKINVNLTIQNDKIEEVWVGGKAVIKEKIEVSI